MESRRNFLRTLIGGVAAVAAERTFPFRVFSFPKEIKIERDYYRIDWPVVSRKWEYGSLIAADGLHFYDLRPFEKLLYPSSELSLDTDT